MGGTTQTMVKIRAGHKIGGMSVRDVPLPVEQVVILLLKAGESFALQGIILNAGHSAFDLAFVTRRVGLGGQDDGTVMIGEGPNLRVEIRVVVIRLDDRRFEVIDDNRLGDASEVVEGVLDRSYEVFRGLVEDDFTVCLAGNDSVRCGGHAFVGVYG